MNHCQPFVGLSLAVFSCSCAVVLLQETSKSCWCKYVLPTEVLERCSAHWDVGVKSGAAGKSTVQLGVGAQEGSLGDEAGVFEHV